MHLNPDLANTENLKQISVLYRKTITNTCRFLKNVTQDFSKVERNVTFKILRFSNLNWVLGDALDIL